MVSISGWVKTLMVVTADVSIVVDSTLMIVGVLLPVAVASLSAILLLDITSKQEEDALDLFILFSSEDIELVSSIRGVLNHQIEN